jgi:hypothetical protein
MSEEIKSWCSSICTGYSAKSLYPLIFFVLALSESEVLSRGAECCGVVVTIPLRVREVPHLYLNPETFPRYALLHGRVDVQTHVFLTSARVGREWPASWILLSFLESDGMYDTIKNFMAVSPQANYTDRATAACRRN